MRSKTIGPRDEFLQSPASLEFADALANPALIVGLRAAMLEFVTSEPRGHAWEDAARSHHYIQGAKDFANYLLTFIDPDPKQPQPQNENLKWPTKESLQQRPPKAAK